jgi:hypothetical protein
VKPDLQHEGFVHLAMAAAERRRDYVNGTRQVLLDGGLPVECVDFVMGRFEPIAQEQCNWVSLCPSMTTRDAAQLVMDHMTAQNNSLLKELLRALLEIWHARQAADLD